MTFPLFYDKVVLVLGGPAIFSFNFFVNFTSKKFFFNLFYFWPELCLQRVFTCSELLVVFQLLHFSPIITQAFKKYF
jgi:hypothetical protein